MTEKKKEESKSKRLQRLVEAAYPSAHFIESTELPGREGKSDLGIFTEEALLTFNLDFGGNLQQTGELIWVEGAAGEVDHFAMHSKFRIGNQHFRVINNGKAIAAFLVSRLHMQIVTVERKWHQKILGFRSGKKWKKITAVLIYLLMFSALVNLFGPDEDKTATATNETSEKVAAKTTEKAAEPEKEEEQPDSDEKAAEKPKASEQATETEKQPVKEKADKDAAAASATAVAATSKATKTNGSTDRVEVTLVKTVDGDTIKVNYNGKEETVRYLLIDTPETKDPNECVQPFGQDASDRNKQLVNSGKLELEFDVGERKDKYGRLLAYVYVDGKSVQKTLLEEGLARVAYVYPPNTRYLDDFEAAEAAAEKKGKAVWSTNGYVGDKGFNGCVKEKEETPSPAPKPKPEPQPKQETSTPKEQETPTPSSGGSAEFFQNCTELRKTYPNGVDSSHPAYQAKMDRDKDNFACER
ncbi:thermonuclease family protein [Terribacillus saccharophilus]